MTGLSAITCKDDNTCPFDIVVPELGEGAQECCEQPSQNSQHHADRAVHDLPHLVGAMLPDCYVNEDGVTRDGNHVIKAGCCYHCCWDGCVANNHSCSVDSVVRDFVKHRRL